jgi:hypothetical protein
VQFPRITQSSTEIIMKQLLRRFCLVVLLLPALSFAAGELLLNEDDLAAKVAKEPDYQLLDARSAGAQLNAPLAFSTKYQKVMPIKKGLVLIVAETDAAAVEIAQSIPAVADRTVFAVKGGAEAWKRVAAKAAPPSAMSDSFVIPMNTCEQGTPLLELKRDKPVEQLKQQPKKK